MGKGKTGGIPYYHTGGQVKILFGSILEHNIERRPRIRGICFQNKLSKREIRLRAGREGKGKEKNCLRITTENRLQNTCSIMSGDNPPEFHLKSIGKHGSKRERSSKGLEDETTRKAQQLMHQVEKQRIGGAVCLIMKEEKKTLGNADLAGHSTNQKARRQPGLLFGEETGGGRGQ